MPVPCCNDPTDSSSPPREMENISRGPITCGDFVTILTEGSMQDNKVASGCKTTEYKSADSPHCIKCNVLRE
jgi:hypothetical protein